MQTKKFDMSKFEALTESLSGKLTNGFSGAMQVSTVYGGTGDQKNAAGCTNTNCAGANCVAHCGG